MLNNKEKLLQFYLVSYFVVSAFQGFTGSVIHIYMIKHISEEFFKVYRALAMLMPIITLLYFKQKVKVVKLRRYFTKIIGCTTIAFTIANIGGMFSPEFRFITICILEGFGACLWVMIMNDLFNNTFKNTDLTIWNNKNKLFNMVGVFIGTLIVICVNVDVNTCLIMQCFAYVYLGIVDYITFTTLKDEYNVFDDGGENNG